MWDPKHSLSLGANSDKQKKSEIKECVQKFSNSWSCVKRMKQVGLYGNKLRLLWDSLIALENNIVK